MSSHVKIDPWNIAVDCFDKEQVRSWESLFSIGNGKMGQRANFEEYYGGDSMKGSYIGGIYYPDKNRMGHWKNGYAEYSAQVLNSAFWIGIDTYIDGERLDLNQQKVTSFNMKLDMRTGILSRRFTVVMSSKKKAEVRAERFVSLVRPAIGAVRFTVTPLDAEAEVELVPYINADVKNEDAAYDEKFWQKISQDPHCIVMQTKKSGFTVCWHQEVAIKGDPEAHFYNQSREEYVACRTTARLGAGESVTLDKFVAVTSSLCEKVCDLRQTTAKQAKEAKQAGFDTLKKEQEKAWKAKWEECDVEIEGDNEAQQAIRFSIFQLLQTYTGTDNRLNVRPKGFTGEKYGESAYWATEAYCIPFYLAAAGEEVARQLLLYRYNHLDKAIENAKLLGFRDGAALYPMVTMNGEECHNEWEIALEEIHRNGVIAYAIYNYIRYTGHKEYLAEYGLEVLLGIARFWAQRITYSQAKRQYVLLGVTGPNEYESNVHNNWYTNYIAVWSLKYTLEALDWVQKNRPEDYERIVKKYHFRKKETVRWKEIIGNMYLPEDEKLGIFLQQEGYLDKEQLLAGDLPDGQRPIRHNWSWDRILRSNLIKQADVLLGLYFFDEEFDTETIRRNFHFYEPRTVHESMLSPCVHAILAARIGEPDKAYEMYLQTARIDLDDTGHDVEEGLHIASMAGSWLAVVEGFAGMRVHDGALRFTPALPPNWELLSFRLKFRGSILQVRCTGDRAAVTVVKPAAQIHL